MRIYGTTRFNFIRFPNREPRVQRLFSLLRHLWRAGRSPAKIESYFYIGFHSESKATMSEIPTVTTDPRDIPLLLEMLPLEIRLLYLKKIPRWQVHINTQPSKFDIFEPRPLELTHIPFVMYSLTQFAKAGH